MRSQKVMTTCSYCCYNGPKMIAAPGRCLKMQHENGVVGVCVCVCFPGCFLRAAHVEWVPDVSQPELSFSLLCF